MIVSTVFGVFAKDNILKYGLVTFASTTGKVLDTKIFQNGVNGH